MLICDKILNMNPENPSPDRPHLEDPLSIDEILPEVIAQIHEREEQRAFVLRNDMLNLLDEQQRLVSELRTARRQPPNTDQDLRGIEARKYHALTQQLELVNNQLSRAQSQDTHVTDNTGE